MSVHNLQSKNGEIAKIWYLEKLPNFRGLVWTPKMLKSKKICQKWGGLNMNEEGNLLILLTDLFLMSYDACILNRFL